MNCLEKFSAGFVRWAAIEAGWSGTLNIGRQQEAAGELGALYVCHFSFLLESECIIGSRNSKVALCKQLNQLWFEPVHELI